MKMKIMVVLKMMLELVVDEEKKEKSVAIGQGLQSNFS